MDKNKALEELFGILTDMYAFSFKRAFTQHSIPEAYAHVFAAGIINKFFELSMKAGGKEGSQIPDTFQELMDQMNKRKGDSS